MQKNDIRLLRSFGKHWKKSGMERQIENREFMRNRNQWRKDLFEVHAEVSPGGCSQTAGKNESAEYGCDPSGT